MGEGGLCEATACLTWFFSFLLSPTDEALCQNLNILHRFSQTQVLNTTKDLTFQKWPGGQGKKHNFTLGRTEIDRVTDYTYLGLKFSANGESKKGFRCHYKNLFTFKSVLYWKAEQSGGPLLNQRFDKWDKSPIEPLHVEFSGYRGTHPTTHVGQNYTNTVYSSTSRKETKF